MLSLASTTIECGVLNWPGADPLPPQDLIKTPFLSNFATLDGTEPSATKISPAESQATSEGPVKVSPGKPLPPPASGFGGRTGLLTASGFLPMVITTRPSGSNLMTMFEPSSTTQMLS